MLTPTSEIGIIVGVTLSVVLQISQMFFDSKRDSKDRLIEDLTKRIDYLQEQQTESRHYIKELEGKIFELTKENSFLKGRMESIEGQQFLKETLANDIIAKQSGLATI